ncbi:MAG: HAD family hydrolase [Tepidimonas sp.]|uniref:HAD family hydrolase n=1 Tax=Tepidimonas sp. TaxID=2002775 RepID=UPI0040551EA9
MSLGGTGLPFDLILFDLDGTLIDTAPEIALAVNDTLEELALEPVSPEQVIRWIGHGTRELLVQALADRWGMTPQAVQAAPDFANAEACFQRHYAARCGTRSQPYPQVIPALDALRSAGVRLAVVTNKESRYTDRVLDAHGLTGRFDRVISGDTFPVKKPNPLAVDDCRSRFGIARERTLLVGDSAIDVQTARNAGVAIWAVPYGYNAGQPVADAAPDRLIEDFGALQPDALLTWAALVDT